MPSRQPNALARYAVGVESMMTWWGAAQGHREARQSAVPLSPFPLPQTTYSPGAFSVGVTLIGLLLHSS